MINERMIDMNNTNYRYIAEGITISNNTRETGLNNNDLIIGPSGAGKTGGYVVPNLLNCDTSIIVADTKCNLSKKYRTQLENKGYKVYVLDFVSPENSIAYNPLKFIRFDKQTGKYNEKDIISISHTLVPIKCMRDPFWEESARILIECLISYVLEALEPEERNLSSVLEIFGLLSKSTSLANPKIEFLEEWSLMNPNSFAARKYDMFSGVIPSEKTWACILQSAADALSTFDYKETKNMFSGENTIDIEKFGKEKSAVFLNVSDTDRSMDTLVNIFYTQVFQLLCQQADNNCDGRLEMPIRIILDDFATNTYIENFDKLVSVIRSREIYVSIILQSMTQLETMYSKSQSTTIVNNFDHVLYLGGSDLETAAFVSQHANRPVNKILALPLDKAYLISRGKEAELVNKIKPYSMISERNNTYNNDFQIIEEIALEEGIPF